MNNINESQQAFYFGKNLNESNEISHELPSNLYHYFDNIKFIPNLKGDHKEWYSMINSLKKLCVRTSKEIGVKLYVDLDKSYGSFEDLYIMIDDQDQFIERIFDQDEQFSLRKFHIFIDFVEKVKQIVLKHSYYIHITGGHNGVLFSIDNPMK